MSLLVVLISAVFARANPAAGSGFAGSRLSRFLSMDDGLPVNFVEDIFMDSSGFLWLATSGGGLCRYDGYDFLAFSTNTSVSVRNNFVRSVAEDGFHRLWIASEGGIDILDLGHYSMLSFPDSPLGEFEDVFCPFVTVDSKGCIWFKSGTSLIRVAFDSGGGIASVGRFDDPALALPSFACEDVDGDGTVWTKLGEGVFRIVPHDDGILQAVPVLEGLSLREDAFVSDFLVRESELWLSTADGLYRYDLAGRAWKHYSHVPSDPSSLSQNFISSLILI